MISLSTLCDISRLRKSPRRVGRGAGGGLGKTCGRGQKGAGARSGYKRRYGYEGGQFRTFMKMPIRGFSNARFCSRCDVVNLDRIDGAFREGEVVDVDALRCHGLIPKGNGRVKILGKGELTKKLVFRLDLLSAGVRDRLRQSGILG